MKRIAVYFLENRTLSWFLLVLILAGGIYSYVNMGKLEDAPFTIKQAVVTTSYPEASPIEVQQQVTEVLEEAIQSLGELYYLKTDNRQGLSKITVYVKKEIRADEMQQLWDKLRRKVSDARSKLPAGAADPVVNDDFGDLLGVFYSLQGDGYSYREMEDWAQLLKKEMLKLKDVAKVELFGIQNRSIEISVNPATMAQRGVTIGDIANAFDKYNRVVDAGALETSSNRLRVEATGAFSTIEELQNMIIVSGSGEYFRLGDIATVEESYVKPARNMMTVDNKPAVGIAISTVPDGNVVEMAELVAGRLEELKEQLPDGLVVKPIYDQGKESAVANEGFVWNLIISVLTVVAVLLFFIGFKNGILIGSGLVFSIFGTLIYMYGTGIALQRMSLAAIIIAMGMLVDNAIVVYDSALVNMSRGMKKSDAILAAVSDTAMPLLAATLIAVLTFMPVYLSPHITGEILSTLFIVIAVSLLLSWVLSITQNVFFIQEFVGQPAKAVPAGELYKGKLYDRFRKVLDFAIRKKYAVVGAMVVLLGLSLWGFRYVPSVFMPQLNKQYFTVDMWLPEGSRIEETQRCMAQLVDSLEQFDEVVQVSSYIGQTAPRFYLANASYGPQPNYASCLVEVETPEKSRALQEQLETKVDRYVPGALVRVNRFELNTVPQALIEARFCGDDPMVLDSLTNVALEIMRKNPKAKNVRNEWGNMTMMVNVDFDAVNAGKINISKVDMMNAVKSVNDGVPVGIYRDVEKKVPVLLRTELDNQTDIDRLADLAVWNGGNTAPLGQVTKDIGIGWEFPLVRTYDRRLSMAAQCDVQPGCTMAEVHKEIREEIESIKLPEGYTFFWDSQYKDQKEAMAALTKYFPLAILFLALILIALFHNFRQPLIIFLILPLSLIGMVVGLLLTGFDFGFFCMAGWLGLLGMIIKNVIVLLDEVNIQRRAGVDSYRAVIEATVSRARPVLMAAITTIFGMIPLLFDVVFSGMAATIVFGLTFATLLTLVVTPSLYAIFYKI